MRRDSVAVAAGGTTAQVATQGPAADPRQDPRAHPKDHILRGTYVNDPAGDVTFAALNIALWGADAALFRRYWDPTSPAALPNVQLLLGMDLVRALRHVFWKYRVGEGLFPPATAAFVAAFNALAAAAKLWLAVRAGRSIGPTTFGRVLPLAAGLFALGSALETGSELQRKRFKASGPKGALCTGGLFGVARNINYAGYITWRTGMALATCSPWAALSPAFHAHDFGSRAVPMLEKYMSEKYGEQWEAYRRATPHRLLPGIW